MEIQTATYSSLYCVKISAETQTNLGA